MKRLIKILAGLVAVVVALAVVAAVALYLLFDPNDYKDVITSRVEQHIGRDVTIPGTIDLSIFPWLGVDLGAVSVANAPAFEDKPLAQIDAARVHVRLLPLLQRRIEVDTITFEGLHLRLARNAEGQTNWAGIVEAMDSDSGAGASADSSTSGDGGFELESVEIGGVEIRDAAVDWQDTASDSSYSLSDFNLTTGRLVPGEPFDLEISTSVAAAQQGKIADIELTTTIDADHDTGLYAFDDLQLQMQAEGDAVPDGEQTLELSGNGRYELEAGAFALDDLHIQSAGMDITGHITGSDVNSAPAFEGELAVAEFDPRALLDALGIEPPELQSDEALTRAALGTRFSADAGSIDIGQLSLALDDTTFEGTAAITDFAAPAIDFDVDADSFNLDDYLPADTGESDDGESGGGASEAGDDAGAEFDLSALRDLILDGTVHVGRLTAKDMVFNDASLAVTASDGVLEIKPLAAGFYDGDIDITALVDVRGSEPVYALQGSLADLQFSPLLEDLVGKDWLSALASLELDLTSRGSSIDAIRKALDGTISYDLRDGAFHGFSLAGMIAEARSRLKGGSDGENEPDTTPFERLAGTFDIEDGKISGDGLSLDTSRLGASGSGTYSLVANALDYTLDVTINEQDGPLAELAGVTIPVHLSGSLFSPQYSIDVEAALKAVAEQRLQEETDKLKEKKADAEKKLKEKLDQRKDKTRKKLQEGLRDLLQ